MVTEMLWSWEKKAGLHGDDVSSNRDIFQLLLADFWQELRILFVPNVNTEEADLQRLEGMATLLQVGSTVLQQTVSFITSVGWFGLRFTTFKWTESPCKNMYFTFYLQVMCHPETGNKRHPQKKKSVKICLEKEEDSENTGAKGGSVEHTAHPVSEPVKEPAFGSLKTQHLEDLVCQLVQLCLAQVNDNKSETHLVFLSLLLRSFHTPRVFKVRLPIILFVH